MASPYRIRTVLAAARRADEVRALVGDRAPVLVRSDGEVAGIAGFAFHRGGAGLGGPRPLPDPGTLLRAGGTVVVTEGLGDHENLGALFRNAAAFGVAAVLVDPTTADPLYRRSVRVSLGHVLRVPWARTGPLPAGLDVLRGPRLHRGGADPGAERRAVAVGGLAGAGGAGRRAEGPGLTAATLAAADRRVPLLPPGVASSTWRPPRWFSTKGAPWGP